MRLNSLNDIERKHRHIFLSPHFDDVVFSCGGTLAVQASSGLRPLVITIFAGVPNPDLRLSAFATQVHRQMGADTKQPVNTVVEARRKEDAAAMDYLEADYLWLDYLDAIYRGSPAYYQNNTQLIGGYVHPDDLWIDKQLAQDLVALQERLPDTVWYAPLGVGRHIDHQIVCSAADRLLQRGSRVYFYEDFPYVLRDNALETRKQELGISELRLVEMSEFLPVRQQAAALYSSQIDSAFGSLDTMKTAMEQYSHNIRPVETIHLERFWTI